MRSSFAPRVPAGVSLLAALLIGTLGCGSDYEEKDPKSLSIVSVGGLTDTAQAVHTIDVTGADGDIGYTDVSFTIAPAGAGSPCAQLGVHPCAWSDNGISVDGHVPLQLSFGTKAGIYSLRLQLPSYDIDTSITITTLPGLPVSAQILPRDTVIVPGGTATYLVHALDASGNARSVLGLVRPTAGGVEYDSTTQVATGGAIGVHRIAGTAEGFADTVDLVVAPDLSFAGIDSLSGHVIKERVDRTSRATVVSVAGASNLGAGLPGHSTLAYRRDNQARTVPVAGGPETTLDTWQTIGVPLDLTVSRDSNWIYSGVEIGNYPYSRLGRFHADGSNEQLVPIPEYDSSAVARVPAARPSPSPDGSRFAYVRGDGAAFIRVAGIAGGASTWMVSGQFPAWGPIGDQVAYVDEAGGRLHLLDANTGSHSPLTADSLIFGVLRPAWSPDGAYLVARFMGSARWALVRVSDGLVLPLYTLSDLREVIFLP